MLYAGKNITSQLDELQKVTVEHIWQGIRNPKPEIRARIRQLRIVRDLDPKRYAQLKRELPYVVCGTFRPAFRRTENFAYTEHFIVDIDHIEAKGISLENIRQKLQNDDRVQLMFLSPGEDGLKLLFHLKERCYDAGLYSLFYKEFVKQLSMQYNLEQVIDARTSDVCRACFISCDENAYYNSNAQPVDLQQFVDISNPFELFGMKHELEKEAKEGEKLHRQQEMETKAADPEGDELLKIKEILKIRIPPKEKKQVFVPEQLEEVIDDVKKYVESTGIVVTEIININYGKKIRMRMGMRQAEVNLFYGKKGFSVTASPRSGTNAELNELCVNLVQSFFLQ